MLLSGICLPRFALQSIIFVRFPPDEQTGDLVTREALRLLYLDASLWVYTPEAVQRQVLESLQRHISHRPAVLQLPDSMPVSLTLFSLIRCYPEAAIGRVRDMDGNSSCSAKMGFQLACHAETHGPRS